MTESKWLACADPDKMLHALQAGGLANDRKFRLFAAACCRRIWHLLPDPRSQAAVEAAERYADGLVDPEELEEVCTAAAEDVPGWNNAKEAAAAAAVWDDASAAEYAADYAARAAEEANTDLAPAGRRGASGKTERAAQADLLRCAFGNPFRLLSVSPSALSWDNGGVVRMAQAAYEERELPSGHLDPARLAVLADALEDAGCDDADLLGHLRAPGPHVRGCWALDLLLGKS